MIECRGDNEVLHPACRTISSPRTRVESTRVGLNSVRHRVTEGRRRLMSSGFSMMTSVVVLLMNHASKLFEGLTFTPFVLPPL